MVPAPKASQCRPPLRDMPGAWPGQMQVYFQISQGTGHQLFTELYNQAQVIKPNSDLQGTRHSTTAHGAELSSCDHVPRALRELLSEPISWQE